MDPACWQKKKKRSRLRKQVPEELRKLYLEHKTANDWVWSEINFHVGPEELLLATGKRWKRAWIRHVTCHNSLSKTIFQGILEGGWRGGWQRECCMGKFKVWISLPMRELLTMTPCRKDWKRISAESSLMSPRWPQVVKGLNWTGLNWSQQGPVEGFTLNSWAQPLSSQNLLHVIAFGSSCHQWTCSVAHVEGFVQNQPVFLSVTML